MEEINEFIINYIADSYETSNEDGWNAKHDIKCLEYQSIVGALLDANLIKLS